MRCLYWVIHYVMIPSDASARTDKKQTENEQSTIAKCEKRRIFVF